MKPLYPWTLLRKRLTLILIFYTIFRALFFALNYGAFASDSGSAVLLAFFDGWRFDLWAIAWVHSPLVLLSFAPWKWQARLWWQKTVLIYVLAVNFWCFGLNAIDLELFQFTGKRLTVDWLRLQQDMQHQAAGLVTYYWWVALLGFVLWLIFWWRWPRWTEGAKAPPHPVRRLVVGVFVSMLLALAMRGGWQLKPLNLANAYSRGSSALGVLRMNSTFSFFRSRANFDSLSLRFFHGKEAERDAILKIVRGESSPLDGKFKGYNVVVILVESLAAEYVGALNQGQGYTPFFDELSKKGTLFRNNFANGRRSIEAVPSVVCGMPSLMGEALILSPYQGIELHCLPEVAGQAGYATHFFHGAYNGSMHFDAFSNRAGFEKFYGFNEYPNAADNDGHWGVFDEPMMKFAVEILNKSQQPFAATIFTLSSHSPYRLPPDLQGKFPKGELEIHPSIGYADHALKRFFEDAEKQSWFDKTIFVITGDHTQKTVDKRYQTLEGMYRVPLLFYVPDRNLGGDNLKLTQHLDILPTLMDLLAFPKQPRLKIGQNIFSPGSGMVYNGDERGYWLLNGKWLLEYLWSDHGFNWKPFDPHTWKSGAAMDQAPDDAARQAIEELRAIIDYHNEGVVQNRLYH